MVAKKARSGPKPLSPEREDAQRDTRPRLETHRNMGVILALAVAGTEGKRDSGIDAHGYDRDSQSEAPTGRSPWAFGRQMELPSK